MALKSVVTSDNAIVKGAEGRLHKSLALLNARLDKNQYLAGSEFTSADIMVTTHIFLSIHSDLLIVRLSSFYDALVLFLLFGKVS